MTVADIMKQATLLNAQERKELVKLLVDSLEVEAYPDKHSILELAGLGAEIWHDIDTDDYINQLRDEWD